MPPAALATGPADGGAGRPVSEAACKLGELQKYSSNQIPTDLGEGTETAAFMGDWTKLLWGIRTEIRIEATRATTDAFRKGQVWIRAYMRGDVALARPAAFVKITGIAEAGDGNGE